MQNCRRCYNETHIIIMSMFSTENICLNCSQKERNHPSYQKAVDADNEAIKNGNFNFKGIGARYLSETI